MISSLKIEIILIICRTFSLESLKVGIASLYVTSIPHCFICPVCSGLISVIAKSVSDPGKVFVRHYPNLRDIEKRKTHKSKIS